MRKKKWIIGIVIVLCLSALGYWILSMPFFSEEIEDMHFYPTEYDYTFYRKKDAFGRKHVSRFIITYMPVSPKIENDPYIGEFSVDIFGRIYAMNHADNENSLIANSFDDFVQKAAGYHYQVCGVPFAYDGIYDWDEDSQRWVYDYYLASFDIPIKYDENGVITFYRNPFE